MKRPPHGIFYSSLTKTIVIDLQSLRQEINAIKTIWEQWRGFIERPAGGIRDDLTHPGMYELPAELRRLGRMR
jgi:hypothetical protein